MKMKAIVPVLFLTCGLVCFYSARRIMEHAGEAALHVRLVPLMEDGQQRLKVFFVNTSAKTLKLNTAGMKLFVYLPENAKTSLLHIWSENSDGARPVYTDLAPGRSIDAGDAYPLIKNLPRETKSITAVYDALASPGDSDGAWRGFVRSPPLPIETAGR